MTLPRRLQNPRALVAFSIAGATVIVVVVALGILHERGVVGRQFDLDAEFEIPAYVSSLLLVAAAVLCWASGTTPARIALSAFFLFMAADELLSFHERLEALTGLDWQTIYIPVVIVGGVAWWAAMRELPWRLSRALLLAGAMAWLAAGVLENVQWRNGDIKVAAYAELMVAEETLEMLGSLCFGLAFAAALAQQSRPGGSTTGR
jgi:hypothetical protein